MSVLALTLENHVNQRVISKHCTWCKNNYLPSQHTLSSCMLFFPWLNTHSEAAQLTIQNMLHAWFSLLLGKQSVMFC